MFMRIVFLVSLLLTVWAETQAQRIRLGSWQSFLSYENCVAVTRSDKTIFAANDLGLMEVNGYEIYFHNKTTGLSDMGIQTIGFNHAYKALIVAYTNGNIDIRYQNTAKVVNLPAIKQNLAIVGSKRVNEIYSTGKKTYFACAFGLVELDMELMEFTQTTFTPNNEVFGCARWGNALFMSTKKGIFRGELDGRNLQDFNVWQRHAQSQNLPSTDYTSNAILNLKGTLYADVNDTLFTYSPITNSWQHVPNENIEDAGSSQPMFYKNISILRLEPSYDSTQVLVVTGQNYFFQLVSSTGQYYKVFFSALANSIDLVADAQGGYWYASLVGLAHSNYAGLEFVVPNSPKSNRTTQMATDPSGRLWVAGSMLAANQSSYAYDAVGFYRWNGSDWKNFNNKTFPRLDTFFDAVSVATNPKKQEIFIGSFTDGIIRILNDEIVEQFNQRNTQNGLQGVVGDEVRTRVNALVCDESGNLWISNPLAPNPIVLRTTAGSWYNFPTIGGAKIRGMAIDKNKYKWTMQINGLEVFSEGKLDDATDNKNLLILQTGDGKALGRVNCVAADLNGAIWAGTTDGIAIFNCGSNIFENGCAGLRPVVSTDNFNAALLSAENVNAIVVDGANRKWVGTDNGLYLISEDGYDRLHHFTVDNSPLFDNKVLSLAIDGKTGMVYIGTERGLLGYRAEATTGKKVIEKSEVLVFPNPVQPDYAGEIAINNIPTDGNVKITDISGRLVHETQALGGQAIWNGYDYNGRRAASGVYLVWAVDSDANQKVVTKIMIIN